MARRAGARVPGAAAARAAAGRARGGGADVRGGLRGRGVADDGLDRRAARAHRPRRRLRGPAAGARRGGARAGGAQAGGRAAAVDRAARRGAPTVATAAAATAAGFLVLALSPLPMVRGFGILLVAGIALALTCALTLGVAALTPRTPRPARRPRRRGLPPAVARGGAAVAASGRGAAELLTQNRAARAVRGAGAGATARVLRTAVRRPGPSSPPPRRWPSPAGGSTRRPRSSPTSRSSSPSGSGRCATSSSSSGRPASAARSTCSSRAAT